MDVTHYAKFSLSMPHLQNLSKLLPHTCDVLSKNGGLEKHKFITISFHICNEAYCFWIVMSCMSI